MPPIARNMLVALAALTLTGLLAGCLTTSVEVSPQVKALARRAGELSPVGQRRLERGMSPGMLALARRLEPGRRTDFWGRPKAWAVLDLATAPHLDFGVITPDEAQRLNRIMPFQSEPPTPAPPFYLRALGPERDRAVLCLTQAIYYEAGLEPTEGQEAVAQVIINRTRHPAFPKSICGVVFQGSQQLTGCQFSFTCDGSRERGAPAAEYWQRAHAVAEQAVSGFVMPIVGTATHYHADYVFPRWGPTLVKLTQIGAHIFYRIPGPMGRPAAFTGPYDGRELLVSMQGPSPEALAAAKAAADAGQVSAPAIDPTAGPEGPHVAPGQVVAGRRVPTKEEIARINAALATYETQHGGGSAQAPPSPPLITPPKPGD